MAAITKNQRSFTLIEIVVAMGIFALLISSLSSIFVQALQVQKKTLAAQEVLVQTSYVLDYLSRALRMAKKDTGGACVGVNLNYAATSSRVLAGQTYSGPGIKFLNYNGVCQEFFLDSASSAMKESRAAAAPVDLTSSDLKVNFFTVNLVGASQDDAIQPQVTLFLDIVGKNQSSKIKVQTAISQRNLDIQR